MALSLDIQQQIAAWSPSDLITANQTWQRTHPDPPGPAADLSPAALIEQRILDILSQRLTAQLAATPLIPAAQQALADRLDALWSAVEVSGWTSQTPAPVQPANFFIGDILESLDNKRLPAVIVTGSLPGGTDVERGAIGTLDHEIITTHVYYVREYDPSRIAQVEAIRAAAALANLLRTYVQDGIGGWRNGRATEVRRNMPRFDKGPRFIVGIVAFTCEVYLPYTRALG